MSADDETRDAPDLPTIVLGHDDAAILDAAEAALVGSAGRTVYQRGGMLVRVLRADEHSATRVRGTLDPDAPVIDVVPAPWLRERLSSVAVWVRDVRGRNGKAKRKRVDVPERVAAQLLARGEWRRFPRLTGLVDAPTLRPDGSILDAPGYCARTGLRYVPSATFPDIPDAPSLDDARSALAELLAPLDGFPFAAESDRAAAVAAILTIVGRSAIPGPVPMFFVTAPTRGTGKSLLAKVVGAIGLGRVPPMRFPVRDPAETRKALLALAMAGARVVVIDNVVGEFGDEVWAGALTAGEVEDRVLGVSKSHTASLLGATFLGTGNGIAFRKDCGRRVVPIYLDAGVENPEDRRDFAIDDVVAHVLANRPALVRAALVILRGFCVAGRPAHGGSRMGSFEAWDDLVRGAVVWCGAGDPAAGRERIRDDDDADREALRGAVGAWSRVFSGEPKTAAEALTAAAEDVDLRAALAGLAEVPEERLTAKVLGKALARVVRSVVDGARFERQGKTHGTVRWKLVSVENSGRGVMGGSGGRFPAVSPENTQ